MLIVPMALAERFQYAKYKIINSARLFIIYILEMELSKPRP